MRNNNFHFNINSIFLVILFLGIISLFGISLLIFNRQRIEDFEDWKNDKIKESLSNTSSYYSNLTTRLVLGKDDEINKLLKLVKESEKTKSITIIKPDDISEKILKTCSVNQNQSFFNQVPICYEIKDDSLYIYHELRSFGYNLGYLVKEIKTEQLPFFKNKKILINIFTMIIIFIFINITTIFFLRNFIILPLTGLNQAISTHSFNQKFRIFEIQKIYESASQAIQERDAAKETVKRMEIESEIGALARQLSHDIRSPLAALKVVKEVGTKDMDSELSKLLTMSIDRITDIANTILPKNTKKEQKDKIQTSFLWMLIDQIISEKRVEYKSSNDIGINFTFNGSPFALNAACNPTEFMRLVSNVINNSIEAKNPNKKLEVSVTLDLMEENVLLTISDNGKGIPSEILSKIFNEGFTHGKTSGTGLGLFQAKKDVESWGGWIGIESQLNIGTAVKIQLKQAAQPKWLIDSVDISKYQQIVVLDDEEYVFNILRDRFESYSKPIQYFKRIDDFEKSLQSLKDTLFFVDHDLKQNQTGINLIQTHQLQARTILLTGNYDDKQVQQKASELDIKILPKPLINDLPIIT